jgi:hypothetical protein
MEASVMFVDCPAYIDNGAVRCGLPAEVEGTYTMRSTDGPLQSARIRCPRGRWFNGPVESLTLPQQSRGRDDAGGRQRGGNPPAVRNAPRAALAWPTLEPRSLRSIDIALAKAKASMLFSAI